MSKPKRNVFVHAWEYVCPGPSAGGGGFRWYGQRSMAEAAFARAWAPGDPENTADFFFMVSADPDTATEMIDANLHELCAKAATRRVGALVLQYWTENNMRMGDATSAAPDEDAQVPEERSTYSSDMRRGELSDDLGESPDF